MRMRKREKECRLTIDILLQYDRKRSKQRLFKRRQGRWGSVYDKSVHAVPGRPGMAGRVLGTRGQWQESWRSGWSPCRS